GIGGDPLPGQRILPPNSFYPGGEGRPVPAWIAFDKQVLSFSAYCQEPVHERRDETYRIRNVKIYFYLEDDSIQIVEPRYKNSGLAQGTILRRHRVHKPPPHDDLFYTVHDFNTGIEINFYNKVYKIVGCDEFTHNFLRKLGVRVNEPEHPPNDPYTDYRKAFDDSMQPLRPHIKVDTLKQFLDHDRHVLRFYCFWDDTDSLYGDPREMTLHYFLSDDTVEIREIIPINAGRDAGSLFLRRQKLPKHSDDLPQPGDGVEKVCLNVFGKIHHGRYLIDSLKAGAVSIEYYKDSDLTIGSYINVFGRKFLICDCDEFTKEYYQTKYGITEYKPIPYTMTKTKTIEKMPVPYNGWGTEEDSLGNCEHFIPKEPKTDFKKFLALDRRGLESHILRFRAHMDTDNPIDSERVFIINYYLMDDTLQIDEPIISNSGKVQN
ncbi:UNVERIFIED_CONTAM: hypothetical protein GTU68_062609, partial [Idotea baltica]|nr:hypothetical protein [Idotea baltica]